MPNGNGAVGISVIHFCRLVLGKQKQTKQETFHFNNIGKYFVKGGSVNLI